MAKSTAFFVNFHFDIQIKSFIIIYIVNLTGSISNYIHIKFLNYLVEIYII